MKKIKIGITEKVNVHRICPGEVRQIESMV